MKVPRMITLKMVRGVRCLQTFPIWISVRMMFVFVPVREILRVKTCDK